MRDPPIDLVVKEFTDIAIQYLCERELLETNEAMNANFAWSRKRLQSWIWPRSTTRLEWRQPVRKRGRPPQRRARHVQIAGAVALLVENAGLNPTRSHFGPRPRGPSACSVVTAALEQLREGLDERTVEGIWNRYRRSPLINHRGATDYARSHHLRVAAGIRELGKHGPYPTAEVDLRIVPTNSPTAS